MNTSSNEPCPRNLPSGLYSLDCVDLILDGSGATTIRPIPPERMAQAVAARDYLRKWQEWERQQQQNGDGTAQASEGDQGMS